MVLQLRQKRGKQLLLLRIRTVRLLLRHRQTAASLLRLLLRLRLLLLHLLLLLGHQRAHGHARHACGASQSRIHPCRRHTAAAAWRGLICQRFYGHLFETLPLVGRQSQWRRCDGCVQRGFGLCILMRGNVSAHETHSERKIIQRSTGTEIGTRELETETTN